MNKDSHHITAPIRSLAVGTYIHKKGQENGVARERVRESVCSCNSTSKSIWYVIEWEVKKDDMSQWCVGACAMRFRFVCSFVCYSSTFPSCCFDKFMTCPILCSFTIPIVFAIFISCASVGMEILLYSQLIWNRNVLLLNLRHLYSSIGKH